MYWHQIVFLTEIRVIFSSGRGSFVALSAAEQTEATAQVSPGRAPWL